MIFTCLKGLDFPSFYQHLWKRGSVDIEIEHKNTVLVQV